MKDLKDTVRVAEVAAVTEVINYLTSTHDLSAEGVGFMGRGCPLPSQIGSLGERRMLPHQGFV